MNKVSVICCFNNRELLKDLKNSLNDYHEYNIEWVVIDNLNNAFSSAASALNYGFRKSEGEVLVFLHQDIIFDNPESMTTIINSALAGNVVGVAGSLKNSGLLISSIYDGPNRERKFNSITIGETKEVQTCDECLIAMTRDVYQRIGGFDEQIFDGWDFYAVDLSLQAKTLGIKTVIVFTELWHRSQGKKNSDWYKYEEELRRKYRKEYYKINYPCGECYTNELVNDTYVIYKPVKKRINDSLSILKKTIREILKK